MITKSDFHWNMEYFLPSDKIHGNPEPVCDGGPVTLRDKFTSQTSNRWKVKANGGLENQERQKRNNTKTWNRNI